MKSMPLALALLLFLPALPAAAQGRARAGPSVEELKSRRDAKLAQDWLKANPWTLDLEKVKAEAAESGKPIFAYFTRSYSP